MRKYQRHTQAEMFAQVEAWRKSSQPQKIYCTQQGLVYSISEPPPIFHRPPTPARFESIVNGCAFIPPEKATAVKAITVSPAPDISNMF